MKVIIESTAVTVKAGTSPRTGKDYSIREQRAFLHGERIRGEIKLNLEGDQPPYPVGEYGFDLEKSVYIGRFQSFGFSPVLVPLEKVQALPVQGPRAA